MKRIIFIVSIFFISLWIWSCSKDSSDSNGLIENNGNENNGIEVSLTLGERAGIYENENLIIELYTNGYIQLIKNSLTSIRGLPLKLLNVDTSYELGDPNSTNSVFVIQSDVLLEANYTFKFPSAASSDIMTMEGGNLIDLLDKDVQTLTNYN